LTWRFTGKKLPNGLYKWAYDYSGSSPLKDSNTSLSPESSANSTTLALGLTDLNFSSQLL
jgi:hypothetical protein